MQFDYTNIPETLKNEKRWVLFKKVIKDGKMTKIPINALTGYGAKSNDNTTWTTFDTALNKCELLGCDGLGFMLGDGYFGIDLDNHIDENGELETSKEDFDKLADEFINQLNSYTEYSQSGNGIHIICKGVLPKGARRKGSIEMYDNLRFFAMTGNAINNQNVEDRTNEIISLYNKYLGKETKAYVYSKQNDNFKTDLTDEEVIIKAMKSSNSYLFSMLFNGNWQQLYKSQSDADLALCNILAFWCNRDKVQIDRIFRKSQLLRDKWDRKWGDSTYGWMTIDTAISSCKNVYNPSFKKEEAKDEKKQNKTYDLNDTGNAERFIDDYGEIIKYNCDNNYWLIFNGEKWARDKKQTIKKLVDELITKMKKEAFIEEDEDKRKELLKNVKYLSSYNGKNAMLKEAIHLKEIASLNNDYDQNPYLLNCKNGIVDLKTGKIMPHDKSLMLSKSTNIDCDLEHEPERWLKFLDEIFLGNKELIHYVSLAIGYSITGDIKEQCFFQCWGDGSNGKGVFFDVMYKMLGDYAINSQADSILAKKYGANNGANNEIARMNGARFVRTNETNDGTAFNEALVKQLVGGDVTTTRFLYGEFFDFYPELKLWINTNYKIGVKGTDKGIWRRNILIPFNAVFDVEKGNIDKELPLKLNKELPQILGWAVKQCLAWQKEGLGNIPDTIKKEINNYRNEMDIIKNFLDDCTKLSNGGREKASDLFKEFNQWIKDNHLEAMTQSRFGLEMKKRFEKKNVNGYMYYYGLILKKNDTSYVFEKEQL